MPPCVFGAGPLSARIHANYVVISPNDPSDRERRMRGTRESRPEVSAAEALL
jgi:hypothetical protein